MSIVKSISSAGQYKCWFLNNLTFKISSIFACRNQGNEVNGRKYSFSLTNIQKPCNDMLLTSISEVSVPRLSDFIFMILNNFYQVRDFFLVESVIMGKFNLGFQPEFCFPITSKYMNMQPGFLPGKEEKTITFISKNSWTHLKNKDTTNI